MRAPLTMLIALGLLSACAEGRPVPELTTMVEVREHLTYDFGPERLCLQGSGTNATPREPTCDQAGWTGVLYPKATVTLTPFAIDEHEVTNLQYEYCVAMGKCTPPAFVNAVDAQSQLDYYGNPTFANYPVVAVTQAQAAEYCFFAGKRLPSEMEWERVAKINNAGLVRQLPTEQANVDHISKCFDNFNVGPCNNNSLRLEEVKSSQTDWVSVGDAKVYELGGNVSEWTSTPYLPDLTCSDKAPCLTVQECRDTYAQNSSDLAFCLQNAQSGPNDPGFCAECNALEDEQCWVMCGDSDSASSKALICSTWVDEVSSEELIRDRNSATVAVRGASVATTPTLQCQLYSWDRSQARSRTLPGNNVGFRCAQDL